MSKVQTVKGLSKRDLQTLFNAAVDTLNRQEITILKLKILSVSGYILSLLVLLTFIG